MFYFSTLNFAFKQNKANVRMFLSFSTFFYMTNMEQKYVYEATQLNYFSSAVTFVFVMFFFYVRNVRKREQKYRSRAIYLNHFSSLAKKKRPNC